MQNPETILIILMGSVGDVARGLTIVPLLKNAFPETKLTWLIEPRCEDLVRACGQLDSIIVFRRGEGLKAVWELRKELRKSRYDVTFDLQRHFKSGLFSFFSGARRRIGFYPRNSKELNWIFNSEYVPYQNQDFPKIDHYRLFVEKLGIQTGEAFHPLELPVPETLREELRTKAGQYLVCVMGSRIPSKDWPAQNYRKLLETLSQENHTLVLVGVKSQAETATQISEGLPVVNLVGKTTLETLIPVLAHARLLIGPDSGPGHIGALFGIRQVTLFGPTPSKRNVPKGSEGLEIIAEDGRMESIGHEEVALRVVAALNNP